MYVSNFVFGTLVLECLCFQQSLIFCLIRPEWRNIVTINFILFTVAQMAILWTEGQGQFVLACNIFV